MKPYTDHIKRRNWGVVAAAWIVSIACIGCIDDSYMNEDVQRPEFTDCLTFATALAPESRTSGTRRSTVANLEIVEEPWALSSAQQDGAATRGELTTHLTGEAGVFGCQYDENVDPNGDGNPDFPITEDILAFTFDGDRLASKNTAILWKTIAKKSLNVYAYAPYIEGNTDMTLNTAASPTIEYTVPAAIDDQQDLLVAKWIGKVAGNRNHPIPLVFDHALTAIRFQIGFECKVTSLVIKNVYNHGTYNLLDDTWTVDDRSVATYTLSFEDAGIPNRPVESGEMLTGSEMSDPDHMILMPQTLPADAEIVLTYVDEERPKEYHAPIGGKVWAPGKLITYTFHKNRPTEPIYFDLAAGKVEINGSTYKGYVYKKDADDKTKLVCDPVSGNHKAGNHYYVYQSSFPSGDGSDPLGNYDNRASIWSDDGTVCTPPTYKRVPGPDGRPWSEYITNNADVESVIEEWDVNNNEWVTAVKRRGTNNWIDISGAVTCDLTIDNIYSVYQTEEMPDWRTKAGISFVPGSGVSNAKVTIKSVGDNRVGAVHYHNLTNNGNEIIFEGTGSLTVADVDGRKGGDAFSGLESGKGYWSNHWSSAIGNHDSPPGDDACYGIVINSGIIFAGTTKAENCTAIGGGGNATGMVTINGGTVTAVATTTGTAIGGGIGFGDQGGEGHVTITGGNVYAYNHANKWNIPSSAIGGAGSRNSTGASGNVTITGGHVYAVSERGTAIGGGSSYTKQGGGANVTISDGEVFAKTGSSGSASIGGGTGYTQGFRDTDGNGDGKETSNNKDGFNGGNANITIYGNPIIRTGSIGGGGTGDTRGKIGNAKIHISGGDISGQFILQAGTADPSIFTMSGGTIRNSDTADEEYLHVQPNGGAVWLQNGTVTIEGGTIENCKAKRGGAIYIEGKHDEDQQEYTASFTMSGGTIQGNEAVRDNNSGSSTDQDTGDSVGNFEGSGGAVYIMDGVVNLGGGSILDNLAAGGHGGGVFIRRGNLKIDGATIDGNASEVRRTEEGKSAGGSGGGVYVYSKTADVNVDLMSGVIGKKITRNPLTGEITKTEGKGNTADRRGGGLCVIQETEDGTTGMKADIIIGDIEGKDVTDVLQICENHSLLQGGGLYAEGLNTNITIYNGGTIERNTVSQYVHNQDVANEQGSVTLAGIDENIHVKHNTVTFHANYGTNPIIETQRIVTETNSKLKIPKEKFNDLRQGYNIVRWNTKPSGSGTDYVDEQIMNINKDITLYAQWELQ